MKVALLHNARPTSPAMGDQSDVFEEYDTSETISAIADVLRLLRVEVHPVEADAELPWRLRAGRFDFGFNIAEGRGRRCREGIPAAVCELMGVPFTGSDMLTLALTLDKAIARRLVSPEVPVARAVLIESSLTETGLSSLAFPVIVRLEYRHLRDQSAVTNLAHAVKRVRWLQEKYDCPVQVEEFVEGREVTIGIAGNGGDTRILGLMESAPALPEQNSVYSLDVKRDWQRRVRYHSSAFLHYTFGNIF